MAMENLTNFGRGTETVPLVFTRELHNRVNGAVLRVLKEYANEINAKLPSATVDGCIQISVEGFLADEIGPRMMGRDDPSIRKVALARLALEKAERALGQEDYAFAAILAVYAYQVAFDCGEPDTVDVLRLLGDLIWESGAHREALPYYLIGLKLAGERSSDSVAGMLDRVLSA